MSEERNHLWSKLELALVCLALVLASVFSNNDMVERLALPSLLVLPAAASVLIHVIRARKWESFGLGFVLFSIAAAYFVVRALFSPVESFATMDLLIILPSFLTAFVVALPENRRLMASWLPWFAVVMVLIQCMPLYQQWNDTSQVPFHDQSRERTGVSGFFGHPNFFASLLGSMAMILLSYAIWFGKNRRNPAVVRRVVWAGVGLLALFAVYSSNSRGALVGVLGALAVCYCASLLVKILLNKRNLKSCVMLGAVGCFSLAALAIWSSSNVAQERSLSDNDFFFSNARTDLLMLAADCEPESFMLGGGSRFYVYESRRVWDVERMNNSLQDPQFVHNEYVETLVNYGAIGMIVMITVIGLLVVSSCFQLVTGVSQQGEKRLNGEWLAMHLGIAGVVTIIAIQCMVDFTLHILPLSLLLGCVVGLLLKSSKKGSFVGLGVVLCSLGAIVVLGGKAFPQWRAFSAAHEARQAKELKSPSSASLFAEAAGKSGHFEHFLEAGMAHYRYRDADSGYRAKAEEFFEEIREIHPYDGFTAVNLARLKVETGELDEALDLALDAEKLVGSSERKYGAKYTLAGIRYRILLRDYAASQSTKNPMSESTYGESVKKCAGLIRRSGKMKFRASPQERQVGIAILADYATQLFRKYKQLGQEAAEKGRYQEALALLSFAQKQYLYAKKWTKGQTHPADLEGYKLLAKQVKFFKAADVELDEELLKQLEQEARSF